MAEKTYDEIQQEYMHNMQDIDDKQTKNLHNKKAFQESEESLEASYRNMKRFLEDMQMKYRETSLFSAVFQEQDDLDMINNYYRMRCEKAKEGFKKRESALRKEEDICYDKMQTEMRKLDL